MEITKINIISDFVSPLSKVPQVWSSNFWRWCGLIVGVFATFTSLFTGIKLYILRLHSIRLFPSYYYPLQQVDDNFDCSDDDEDRETTSGTESESIVDEIDSANPREGKNEREFNVYGSCFYDNRREVSSSEHQQSRIGSDWSEFAAGKSVVKQWNSLGLGLELLNSFKTEVIISDFCEHLNICNFFGGERQIPAGEISSPAVTYLAEMNNSNGVAVTAYDRRMRSDIPVIYAEWSSRLGNVAGVRCEGVAKVYVKYGGACTVGDMRNFRNPLEI